MLSKFKTQKAAIWGYAGLIEARAELAMDELAKGYTHKALFHLEAIARYRKQFELMPLQLPEPTTTENKPDAT